MDKNFLILFIFGILTAILPIFWAWQNRLLYKKKWLYLFAIVTIMLGLQSLVAIAVFIIYLFIPLWKEFQLERQKKSNK